MDNRLTQEPEWLAVLIEILDLDPICLRYSPYSGVEIVLSWDDDEAGTSYRAITVTHSLLHDKILCVSSHPFPGAVQSIAHWILYI